MSLFASLAQGDIWSLSGISFNSPINDILDRGGYSLEELLGEDELIQEVKSKNDRLIDFLVLDNSVEKLIDFVVVPARPEDSVNRRFKFPYMSCEVICCEVPELLEKIVQHYLPRLMAFLSSSTTTTTSSSSSEEDLDCYLAGYFEKILDTLFRKNTSEMMAFLNAPEQKGLLPAFLGRISNYSIMQIVQRLMLPHIPFNGEAAISDSNPNLLEVNEAGHTEAFCRWAYEPETGPALVDAMIGSRHTDVPLHLSDLIITVLQLSPPETLLVRYLCQPDVLDRLLAHALQVQEVADLQLLDGSCCGPLEEGPNYAERCRLLAANTSLAATAVLESLVSRLYEAEYSLQEMLASSAANANGQSPTQQGGAGRGSAEEEATQHTVQSYIDTICAVLLPHLPRLKDVLMTILQRAIQPAAADGSSCGSAPARSPRLGHHGLQLVKLIEAVIRLGNEAVEASLCRHSFFPLLLLLFLQFEQHAILQLAVQRVFVMLLEAAESRCNTQIHLLTACPLLDLIMHKVQRLYYAQGEQEEEQNLYRVSPGDCVQSGSGERVALPSVVKSCSHSSDTEVLGVPGGCGETSLEGSPLEQQQESASDKEQELKVSLLQRLLSLPIVNPSRHSSAMGNLMLIAQAACLALGESAEGDATSGAVNESGNSLVRQQEDDEGDFGQFHSLSPPRNPNNSAVAAANQQGGSQAAPSEEVGAEMRDYLRYHFLHPQGGDEGVARERAELLTRWDRFVQRQLKPVLQQQGGNVANSTSSGVPNGSNRSELNVLGGVGSLLGGMGAAEHNVEVKVIKESEDGAIIEEVEGTEDYLKPLQGVMGLHQEEEEENDEFGHNEEFEVIAGGPSGGGGGRFLHEELFSRTQVLPHSLAHSMRGSSSGSSSGSDSDSSDEEDFNPRSRSRSNSGGGSGGGRKKTNPVPSVEPPESEFANFAAFDAVPMAEALVLPSPVPAGDAEVLFPPVPPAGVESHPFDEVDFAQAFAGQCSTASTASASSTVPPETTNLSEMKVVEDDPFATGTDNAHADIW